MARNITTGTVTTSMKASTRPVISWGAIFGGAVVGLALLALLSSLWLALAYESQTASIRANLEWYIGGSALACRSSAGRSPGTSRTAAGPADPARMGVVGVNPDHHDRGSGSRAC